MQFSERWLRTLTDPPLDTAALCNLLTMAGLEVEDAAPAAPPFTGVVVGRIDRVAPHPDADRLRVCTVDAGGSTPLQIVCGAPNAAAGMKVPLAHVGAVLPDGTAIRKASVRGVESSGMLCSAKELGLSDDAAGLYALTSDAPVGADLRATLSLDDRVITLKVTPNRADCLSMIGLARDVAAAAGSPLVLPDIAATPVAGSARRDVRVQEPAGCPRFVSRTIEGIDPKAPTPAWMKERLERSGVRSISAVVDITNYVMLEQGQPLHAYDDRFLEGSIVVRFARAGEKLTLLNGQVLDLEPDLLLVCDEKKPLGLAGIMGGEHSGIGDATTTVLLEGAFWSPAVIQGRSRRLGFVSDAGYRFERGVDFGNCASAVERATQLILAICGGRAGPLGDVTGVLPAREPVRVRPARIRRLLGIDVPDDTIRTLFVRLGLAFTRDGPDFIVTPPTYRFDLAIEEDLVEEVARLVGYDTIPAKPSAHVQIMLPDAETALSAVGLKRRLVARDWQEAITFSFVSSAAEAALFPDRDPKAAPIAIQNPIATHLDVMRTDSRRRPARRAADQPRAPARSNPGVRGRAVLPARRQRGRRSAVADRRSRVRPGRARAMGDRQATRRLSRRQGGPRGAGRAADARHRRPAPSAAASRPLGGSQAGRRDRRLAGRAPSADRQSAGAAACAGGLRARSHPAAPPRPSCRPGGVEAAGRPPGLCRGRRRGRRRRRPAGCPGGGEPRAGA